MNDNVAISQPDGYAGDWPTIENALSGPCVETVYRCKVCGVQKRDVNRWYLLEIDSVGFRSLFIHGWLGPRGSISDGVAAGILVPVCGEAHAQVLVSRWFESKSFEPSRQFIPEEKK